MVKKYIKNSKGDVKMYANYEMNVKLMNDYWSGDPVKKAKAVEQLIKSVEPFMHKQLKNYEKFMNSNNYEDFVQVAYMAIVKVLPEYNPKYSLTTILPFCIKHEIQKYISDITNVKPHYSQRINRIQRAIEKLQNLGIDEPTVSEIAGVVGISEKQVLDAMQIRDASLLLTYENEEMCSSMFKVHADSPEEIFEKKETERVLVDALQKLDEMQKDCLLHAYGACGFSKMKHEEIANRYNISLREVKSNIAKALKNVRRFMNSEQKENRLCRGQHILDNRDIPVLNDIEIDIYIDDCDKILGDSLEELELK